MIKKTITYEDFNGDTHTEDFYFHLSKSELTKAEISESIIDSETEKVTGGLRARIEEVTKSGRGKDIMELFEWLIRKSYGIRSEDGKRFKKSDSTTEDFMDSAAYDVLFMELVTETDQASAFVNGVVPKDLAEEVAKQDKPEWAPKVVEARADLPEAPRPDVELTPEEIKEIMAKRSQDMDN